MNPTPDSHVALPFVADSLPSSEVEVAYHSDRIVVGSGSIHIGRRRYPIDRMRQLRIVRVRYRQLRFSAVAVASLSTVAWVRLWEILDINIILAVGAVALVPILLAAFGMRRCRRREIVAHFDGLPTLIIRDKDPRKIERVIHEILTARATLDPDTRRRLSSS